jgi:hypothetical protein
MRTTVTFEPDVHALVQRYADGRDQKQLINQVMRLGFSAYAQQQKPKRPPFKLPVHTGAVLIENVDNIHDVLATLDELEPAIAQRHS